MSTTLRGTIKWFNDAKGFGFINHPDGKDVFVHYSTIQTEGFRTLVDGEMVEYEVTQGPKGLHAAKVFRLSHSHASTNAESDKSTSPLRGSIEVERISELENTADEAKSVITELSASNSSTTLVRSVQVSQDQSISTNTIVENTVVENTAVESTALKNAE